MKPFLYVTVFTVAFVVTHSLTIPTKNVPDSVIENLLGSALLKNGNSKPLQKITKMSIDSLPLHIQASFRQTHGNYSDEGDSDPFPSPAEDFVDNEDDQCDEKNGRAVTIASDYYGRKGNNVYVDRQYHFMRFALGLNEKEIEALSQQAIGHLKYKFGVNFNGTLYTESGVSYDPKSKISTAAVIFEKPLRVVSDSQSKTKCSDTTAVLGGWMATGEDIFLREKLEFGYSKRQFYKGPVSFFIPYLVFRVGTPQSTRVFMFPDFPLYCPLNGACPLSGIFLDIDDLLFGHYDGLSIDYEIPGYKYTNVMRISLLSPGRFTPGLDRYL